MPYYNKITIIGHLVRNPDLRYSKNGNGVCNFTVAVNRRYGDDETDFFKVAAWDRGNYKLAEYCANDLSKGKLVTVIGECQIEEYNDNRQPKINADKVIYERDKKGNDEQDSLEDVDEDDEWDDMMETPF